jgi:hypothetical protein
MNELAYMTKNDYFCKQNNKQYMLSVFKNYLNSKGKDIVIQKEDETTVSFTYNELFYIFVHDKSDPYYFRLILPNVVHVQENRKNDILNKINEENTKFKVAKSTIINENVWISVEQFVYSMERINDLFERSLILLQAYINDFREKLHD